MGRKSAIAKKTIDMKAKVSKTKGIKKERKRQIPYSLRSILPIIVRISDFESFTPEQLANELASATMRNSYTLLDKKQREQLRNYLIKYGYELYF